MPLISSTPCFRWYGVAKRYSAGGNDNGVESIVYYNNLIYGCTALSSGTPAKGTLYEWDPVTRPVDWTRVAPQLGAETSTRGLTEYNNLLYAGTSPNGNLYEWNGVNAWVQRAPLLGLNTGILCMYVFNGKLYAGTGHGELLQWNDVNAWVSKAPRVGLTVIYSLIEFHGELYGLASDSRLFKWNGVNAWVVVLPAAVGYDHIVGDTFIIYKTKLYAGTLYGALLEYDIGYPAWIVVSQFLPPAGYGNVTSTVYENKDGIEKLFFGLSQSGGGGYPQEGHLIQWNEAGGIPIYNININRPGDILALLNINNVIYGGTYARSNIKGSAGTTLYTLVERQLWINVHDDINITDSASLILTSPPKGLYWDWDELERSTFDYRVYRDTAGDDWSDWVMFPWQSYVVKVSRGTEPIDIEFCSDENQKFSYISLDEQGFIRLLAVRGFRTRNNVPGRNANYQVIVFR